MWAQNELQLLRQRLAETKALVDQLGAHAGALRMDPTRETAVVLRDNVHDLWRTVSKYEDVHIRLVTQPGHEAGLLHASVSRDVTGLEIRAENGPLVIRPGAANMVTITVGKY